VGYWGTGLFEGDQPLDAAHGYLHEVESNDPTLAVSADRTGWTGTDMAVIAVAQACGADMQALTEIIEEAYEAEMEQLGEWNDGGGLARSLVVLEWHDRVTGKTEPYALNNFNYELQERLGAYLLSEKHQRFMACKDILL
jgi:hypothetical protein